jgi:hypothetical protein
MFSHLGNASYFKLRYGHYSYTRQSPTLPPDDVEATSCLDVTAFADPDIRPIAIWCKVRDSLFLRPLIEKSELKTQ